MITIKFNQCGTSFQLDEVSNKANLMPIFARNDFYEQILLSGNGDYSTIDEHMILVAQHLVRTNKIKDVKIIEVCGCNKTQFEAMIDKEGDLPELAHSFFTTRLKYLR